jgi:hypothetical protein
VGTRECVSSSHTHTSSIVQGFFFLLHNHFITENLGPDFSLGIAYTHTLSLSTHTGPAGVWALGKGSGVDGFVCAGPGTAICADGGHGGIHSRKSLP